MTARPVVAVFGGSFNPPHVGHQLVCLYVLETHAVSRVAVVPTYRHAFDKQLEPFEERVAMCRLCAEPLGPRVFVSDIEREIGGEVSRTIVTLGALGARHPDTDFRLIIGADILRESDKWYRWADIVRLAPPIVIGRQGYPTPAGVEASPPVIDVSSTEIRARLGRGESIERLVPSTVAAHIAGRKLYGAAP